MTKTEIIAAAMQLPADDRAQLVEILQGSLELVAEDDSAYFDEFAEELNRRLDAVDRGEHQTEDAFAALEESREALKERRRK